MKCFYVWFYFLISECLERQRAETCFWMSSHLQVTVTAQVSGFTALFKEQVFYRAVLPIINEAPRIIAQVQSCVSTAVNQSFLKLSPFPWNSKLIFCNAVSKHAPPVPWRENGVSVESLYDTGDNIPPQKCETEVCNRGLKCNLIWQSEWSQ